MKRLDYIDTAKGICMLLIVFGHCGYDTAPPLLITWIYSFHVIAFYIISGLLSAHISEFDRPWKTLIKKSFFRLMVPYYGFQILFSIIYCVRFGLQQAKWLLVDIVILAPENYATWFLPVLFFARLFVIAARKTIKNTYAFFVVLILLMIVTMSLPISSNSFIALAERSLVASGFIAIGMMFDKIQSQVIKWSPTILISLALSVVLSRYNGLISTFAGAYQNPGLCTLAGIAGTLFMLSLSSKIHSKVLSDFGQHTLLVVGTHQLLLQFLPFHYAVSFLLIFGLEYSFIKLSKLRQRGCCT